MLPRFASALIVLIALPHLAAADDPPAAEAPVVMRGPFKTAFDDVCAEITAKTKADGFTDGGKTVCRREATLKSKLFLAAEIDRALIEGETADYYVSVKTADGWFVSATPVEVMMSNGHAGSSDELTSATAKLSAQPKAAAIAASFHFRYRMDCNECTPKRKGVERWTVTTQVVCKSGADGKPVCLPEVTTSTHNQ